MEAHGIELDQRHVMLLADLMSYRYYQRVENQAGLQNTLYFCLITTNAEITVFSGRTKNFA
jgi:hypothetical protein